MPAEVAGQVAILVGVGDDPVRVTVRDDTPDGVCLQIPPDALKQILFNLIDNAREAGGPGARAEVRIAVAGARVVIDVLDEGPGIPDDAMPHLFDPFFTTKGAVHGVGLGLVVAEGLARRYGGRMAAANREDRPGARFTLEVPVVPDDVGEARS
jgi:two-component system sensor histidine kinase KdpD